MSQSTEPSSPARTQVPWRLVPDSIPSIETIKQSVRESGLVPPIRLQVVDPFDPVRVLTLEYADNGTHRGTFDLVKIALCSVDSSVGSRIHLLEIASLPAGVKPGVSSDLKVQVSDQEMVNELACVMRHNRHDPSQSLHQLMLTMQIGCVVSLKLLRDHNYTNSFKRPTSIPLPSVDSVTRRLVFPTSQAKDAFRGKLKLIVPQGGSQEWVRPDVYMLEQIDLKDIECIRIFAQRAEFVLNHEGPQQIFVVERCCNFITCDVPSVTMVLAWLVRTGHFVLSAVTPDQPEDLFYLAVPNPEKDVDRRQFVMPMIHHEHHEFGTNQVWRVDKIRSARFLSAEWIFAEPNKFYHKSTGVCREFNASGHATTWNGMKHLGYAPLCRARLEPDGQLVWRSDDDKTEIERVKVPEGSALAHDLKNWRTLGNQMPTVEVSTRLSDVGKPIPPKDSVDYYKFVYNHAKLITTDFLNGERQFDLPTLRVACRWSLAKLLGFDGEVPFTCPGRNCLYPLMLAAGDMVQWNPCLPCAKDNFVMIDVRSIETMRQHCLGLLVAPANADGGRDLRLVLGLPTDDVSWTSAMSIQTNTISFGTLPGELVKFYETFIDREPLHLNDGSLVYRFRPDDWKILSVFSRLGVIHTTQWLYQCPNTGTVARVTVTTPKQ